MEIVKFIFACFGSFVTEAGFFGGLWARYQKKQEDKIASAHASAREQIKAIEARAREEIKEVREGAIIKTDKLEKRIDALESQYEPRTASFQYRRRDERYEQYFKANSRLVY